MEICLTANSEDEAIKTANHFDDQEWYHIKHEILAAVAEEIPTPLNHGIKGGPRVNHSNLVLDGVRRLIMSWWP